MITSSDASALASTDAGRSAAQRTIVPSRGRVVIRASAPSVTIGSKPSDGSAGPPYLAMLKKRWSHSHNES